MPKINPQILVWARESAGLPRDEAAQKLGINPAHGVAPVDRLSAFEAGEAEPSRPLLVKMAKQYRRPLLTFFLSAPPRTGDRGADFRTLPDEAPPAVKANLDALVREVQARQSMVRAVLEEEEEAEPLPFVGSRNITDGQRPVLASLQALLAVKLEAYRAQSSAEAAFKLLRASVEKAGVFVLLKSDLGSYHTAIETEIFRGFAIADKVAPFVVINERDARPAWSFTLLHELTHLILGQTGVGNARAENEIERFCNDVAGEFLLPRSDLARLSVSVEMTLEETEKRIGKFAKALNLSRTMVAYKAWRADILGRGAFDALTRRFRRQWLEGREFSRERARQQDGGPSYYTVRRHRVGDELIALARRMMASGALSTSRSARILDVKPHQVQALLGLGAVR